MKRISGAKIVEDFKILVNSLYEHQGVEENEKFVEALKKEIKTMGGDLKAVVKVDSKSKKKQPITTTYEIDDAVYGGIDLPKDTEIFQVSVEVLSKIKDDNMYSFGRKTPFKSMLFILSENAKVLTDVSAQQGIRIIRDMELYASKTGDRIRFGEEKKVEL